MQKKNPLFSFFLLFSILFLPSAKGQMPSLDWAYEMEIAHHLTDNEANIFSVGRFWGSSIDMDPGAGTFFLYNNGSSSMYIRKLDENKNFLWAKKIGGNSNSSLSNITFSMDDSHNLYIYGYINGLVDFDPGPSTQNVSSNINNHNFICKIDSDGNFKWAKLMNTSANLMKVDDLGNIYFAGSFTGTRDFDYGVGIHALTTSPINTTNTFISKYDSDFNYKWVKQIKSSAINIGTSIALDSWANIYISGTFIDSADFDPGSSNHILHQDTSIGINSHADLYTCKLDSSGNFTWARHFYGSLATQLEVNSMCIDDQNNIYSFGRFDGLVGFDSESPYSIISLIDGPAMYINKMNSSGTHQWTKTINANHFQYCFPKTILVDQDEDLYLYGEYQGEMDFDPGTNEYPLDVNSFQISTFLTKWNGSGNFIWAKNLTSSTVRATQLQIDSDKNLFFTGNCYGQIEVDPSISDYFFNNSTSLKYFMLKWNQCVTTNSLDVFGCLSYTNPSGTHTYYDTGVYMDTLSNSVECDSVLTLNLTIGIDESISISNDTLRSNLDNANYKWLNCGNITEPIPGETNQIFIPTQNGNYAVEVSKNGCVEYSPCVIFSLAVNDIEFGNDILLFPNPVKNELYIDLGKNYDLIHMTIRNPLGQIVVQESFKHTAVLSTTLDKEPGIYLVELKTPEGYSSIYKVIKQ